MTLRFGNGLLRQADDLARFSEDAPRVTRTYPEPRAPARRPLPDRDLRRATRVVAGAVRDLLAA